MAILLKEVRLAFPVLWNPERFEGQGEPRYDAVFLIVPGSENDKKLRAAIKEAANATWKDKAAQILKSLENQPGKYCYQDGELKSLQYEGYKDHWALSTHRQAKLGPPKVVDAHKNVLTPESGKPYSGCFVNAAVDIWCQKPPYLGVRGTLIAVQFVKDGTPFAGAPATDEYFEVLETEDDFDFAKQ